MANIDLHAAGIDFNYVLLDNYHSFGLEEVDLAVLLMIDHLLRKGDSLITADLLSLKMNLGSEELDRILSKLVKDGYLSYEKVGKKMVTSLNPLKEKLYKAFELSIAKDRQSLFSEERSSALKRIYDYYEKRLNRVLSPLENELISSWLDAGYTEEEIRNALEDALAEKKKSFKQIDRLLKAGRVRKDVAAEGYSGVDSKWDKDIEKTIEIAKMRWIDDDDGDEED